MLHLSINCLSFCKSYEFVLSSWVRSTSFTPSWINRDCTPTQSQNQYSLFPQNRFVERVGKRTSVFEYKSVSLNSLTPNSNWLVSANATPTLFPSFSFPFNLIAIIIGFANKSAPPFAPPNNKSSTWLKLPGLASFDNFHLNPVPPPLSEVKISILNCFVVSASRRKEFATAWERVTEGSPRGSEVEGEGFPKYFKTVWVL